MRHVAHFSARILTADAAGYVAELAESLRCGGGTGARRRRGGQAALLRAGRCLLRAALRCCAGILLAAPIGC